MSSACWPDPTFYLGEEKDKSYNSSSLLLKRSYFMKFIMPRDDKNTLHSERNRTNFKS